MEEAVRPAGRGTNVTRVLLICFNRHFQRARDTGHGNETSPCRAVTVRPKHPQRPRPGSAPPDRGDAGRLHSGVGDSSDIRADKNAPTQTINVLAGPGVPCVPVSDPWFFVKIMPPLRAGCAP